MRQTILKSMVAIGVLTLGVAACGGSSSSSSSGTPKTATGQPLVIESTPLAPMTDNFNPLSSTSTGFITNSVALYNEPLYIWNYLQPTKPGIPVLASGQPTWSNAGKTLTIPIRSGVKWNDGKPFTASDVAFTFNMIKAHPALYTSGAPVVASATAPSATSVTLNFAQPQYANLFLIGQVYIEPQHVWASVGNPVSYTDPSPVGTGPFMLSKFSPQGYILKQNPFYYKKASVHVPEIDFPSYNTNANLVPPIQSGSIDWAGNYVSDIQGNYLSKSPENHTWLSSAPYFNDNNVVSLFVNTTKAPLNDPAVRQAISYGINRQQLSQQGETGYEPPTSSASGLMLPVDNSYLPPSQSNDLPAAGDPAKVASILRPTATPRSTASGARMARRSLSRFPTRFPTATTTPTTAWSRTSSTRWASTSRWTGSATRPYGPGMSPTAPSTPRSTGRTRDRARSSSTTGGWTAR